MKRAAILVWIIFMLCFAFPGTGGGETAVDADLSACGRGVTYAQMILVCNAPGDYDGKVFRLNGKFNYAETLGVARIIFSDNSGCCELALSFEPAEPLIYPDDYPPLYSDITITARLVADVTGPEPSCRFVDAVMEWKKGGA